MVIIGLAQMKPKLGDLEYNHGELMGMLLMASEQDVDVLVVPELANSGYEFDSKKEVRSLSEEIPNGIFCRTLIDWSKNGGLVVAGICERDVSGLYNSAVIIAGGKYLATYRKVHLFAKEKDWFIPGTEEPPVIEHHGHNFGVMVCFDWAFPEMARVLALKGAQIILHPANLVLPYCQNAMITRSLENRIFTATANRIGEERGLKFSGMSQVTNPKGDILVRMSTDECSLGTCEVDLELADNKMITKQNHVLKDRKPKVYKRLTESI